jgi:hypothetical protein
MTKKRNEVSLSLAIAQLWLLGLAGVSSNRLMPGTLCNLAVRQPARHAPPPPVPPPPTTAAPPPPTTAAPAAYHQGTGDGFDYRGAPAPVTTKAPDG